MMYVVLFNVTISLLQQKKFEDQCRITFFVPMHLFCNSRSHTALFESIINFALSLWRY